MDSFLELIFRPLLLLLYDLDHKQQYDHISLLVHQAFLRFHRLEL